MFLILYDIFNFIFSLDEEMINVVIVVVIKKKSKCIFMSVVIGLCLLN